MAFVEYDPKAAAGPSTGFVEYTPVAPPEQRGRTFVEELKRQAGRTARMGIEAATGTAGVIGDAVAGTVNLVQPNKIPMPSQSLKRMLKQLGLPEDETVMEKVTGFLGTAALGGAVDPVIGRIAKAASQMAPAGYRPTPTAETQVAQELHEAGVKLPPTSMQGGPVTRTLEGYGGASHTATAARAKNQGPLRRLASQQTDVPATNLTENALAIASKEQVQLGYEPIKQIPRIYLGSPSVASTPYHQGLNRIAAKYRDLPQAREINSQLGTLRRQQLSGEAALERIKQLRADATDAFRSDNTNYGRALREMSQELEAQVERNLPKGSDLLKNYRAARMQIAKNEAVKDMLVDSSTGYVSPAKAHELVEKGSNLTDGLSTIAKAGSPQYRRSTEAPRIGEGTSLNWGDAPYMAGAGGIGAGIGALFGGPVGAGLGALAGTIATPVMRSGARKLVLSEPVQAMLMRQMTGAPSIFGAPAARVGAATIPLFSQGEQ